MTACPQRRESRSATSGALKSAALPAGTGVIKRTVRRGQSEARTVELQQKMVLRRRPTRTTERRHLMAPSFSDLSSARFWLSATGSGANVFFICHHHMRHQIDEELTLRRFETRQQPFLRSECSRT